MRALSLAIKSLLFLLLLSFALKNSELVTVRYLMGLEWQLPLSLILLMAFAAGALLGLLGGYRQVLNNRRELIRLRKAAGQGRS